MTVNAIAPRARTRMTETVLGDYGMPPADGGFDEWDPDNIGPVVAWLASDDAADVTGQVFVVFGGRIHLMENWTMVSEIEQGERWSVDAIARAEAGVVRRPPHRARRRWGSDVDHRRRTGSGRADGVEGNRARDARRCASSPVRCVRSRPR